MQPRVTPVAVVAGHITKVVDSQFKHLRFSRQLGCDCNDTHARLRALVNEFAVGQQFIFHRVAVRCPADGSEPRHAIGDFIFNRCRCVGKDEFMAWHSISKVNRR